MKYLFIFFYATVLIILGSFKTWGQATISFSVTDSIGYGAPGSQIEIFGAIHNLTGSTIQFNTVRVSNSLPKGWSNQFCLENCYAPSVDSVMDTISALNSHKEFYTSWSDSVMDTGHVLMKFYDIKNPSDKIYQNFYGIVGLSGIPTIQVTTGPIGIYPNPFTTRATLSIPDFLINNGSNITFIMYNETGRVVRSILISNSGIFNLERDNLPPGLYFYSFFYKTNIGGNNSIQRGKLVIF